MAAVGAGGWWRRGGSRYAVERSGNRGGRRLRCRRRLERRGWGMPHYRRSREDRVHGRREPSAPLPVHRPRAWPRSSKTPPAVTPPSHQSALPFPITTPPDTRVHQTLSVPQKTHLCKTSVTRPTRPGAPRGGAHRQGAGGGQGEEVKLGRGLPAGTCMNLDPAHSQSSLRLVRAVARPGYLPSLRGWNGHNRRCGAGDVLSVCSPVSELVALGSAHLLLTDGSPTAHQILSSWWATDQSAV